MKGHKGSKLQETIQLKFENQSVDVSKYNRLYNKLSEKFKGDPPIERETLNNYTVYRIERLLSLPNAVVSAYLTQKELRTGIQQKLAKLVNIDYEKS